MASTLAAGWRTRVKPLLGTLVEISLPYRDEANFLRATDAAFERVQAIHSAMSFHEATSDVRAIARARSGDRVRVSADTFRTLALALDIERESAGVFNPSVAPELVGRGLLPNPNPYPDAERLRPEPASLAASIALVAPDVVVVLQAVWIDLGGIAKGCAVDAAADALQAADAGDGVVNAGGDLRVFGAAQHTLSVRLPASPTISMAVAEIKNLSCATSGGYLLNCTDRTDTTNTTDTKTATLATHPGIVGPRSPVAARTISVSVIARRCAVADALTKVIWLLGADDPICSSLLKRYEASAVSFDLAGNVSRVGVA